MEHRHQHLGLVVLALMVITIFIGGCTQKQTLSLTAPKTIKVNEAGTAVIRGTATTSAKVTAQYAKSTGKAVADHNGKYRIHLRIRDFAKTKVTVSAHLGKQKQSVKIPVNHKAYKTAVIAAMAAKYADAYVVDANPTSTIYMIDTTKHQIAQFLDGDHNATTVTYTGDFHTGASFTVNDHDFTAHYQSAGNPFKLVLHETGEPVHIAREMNVKTTIDYYQLYL